MDNYNDVIKACNQIYQLLSLRTILITEGIFLETKRFQTIFFFFQTQFNLFIFHKQSHT